MSKLDLQEIKDCEDEEVMMEFFLEYYDSKIFKKSNNNVK